MLTVSMIIMTVSVVSLVVCAVREIADLMHSTHPSTSTSAAAFSPAKVVEETMETSIPAATTDCLEKTLDKCSATSSPYTQVDLIVPVKSLEIASIASSTPCIDTEAILTAPAIDVSEPFVFESLASTESLPKPSLELAEPALPETAFIEPIIEVAQPSQVLLASAPEHSEVVALPELVAPCSSLPVFSPRLENFKQPATLTILYVDSLRAQVIEGWMELRPQTIPTPVVKAVSAPAPLAAAAPLSKPASCPSSNAKVSPSATLSPLYDWSRPVCAPKSKWNTSFLFDSVCHVFGVGVKRPDMANFNATATRLTPKYPTYPIY